jgi:hypothetical protein
MHSVSGYRHKPACAPAAVIGYLTPRIDSRMPGTKAAVAKAEAIVLQYKLQAGE